MSEGGFLEGFDTTPSKETPPAKEGEGGFDVSVVESEVSAEVAKGAAERQESVVAAQGSVTQVESEQPKTIEEVHDQVYEEVEKIVDDGIEQMTETMDPVAKERFVNKGKEITKIIAAMVRGFHVKAKEVLRLLKDWFLTIPGVNRFFLEQEVKIKTDRIIELEQVRREDPRNS